MVSGEGLFSFQGRVRYCTVFLCLLMSVMFSSCANDSEEELWDEQYDFTPLTDEDYALVDYFTEIALGFEFSNASRVIRKWDNSMKVYVEGKEDSPLLMKELESIRQEINSLATDGFSVELVDKLNESNFYIFLGSAENYKKKSPQQSRFLQDNWGLFTVDWNKQHHLFAGKMYVDTHRANLRRQKHLLREELTQALGLGRDSEVYDESIFQQQWTETTQYAEMDKEIIRLLYHPLMTAGMNKTEVERVSKVILLQKYSEN